MARALFISGFNRSGTTLVTTAATEAADAVTLTVADLARHLPNVQEFLTTSRERNVVHDRGVDRLPVVESTPEEYGWFLNAKTGEFAFGDKAAESGVLTALVDELAGPSGAPVVVLKNPWDTGNELALLDHLPDSRVILVRRRLAAIEDSLSRAWARMATSNEYLRALVGDPDFIEYLLNMFTEPAAREKMVNETLERNRLAVDKLIRSVPGLPLDRVAFVSYDELRDNPRAGAAWAAHVLDPDAFGKAIAGHTFPEYNAPKPVTEEVHALDERWAAAWQQVRERQVEAGIVQPPTDLAR